MRLLDRIAMNKVVSMVLNFIISLFKIFAPKIGEDLEKNNPIPPLPKPPIRKRIRPRKEK